MDILSMSEKIQKIVRETGIRKGDRRYEIRIPNVSYILFHLCYEFLSSLSNVLVPKIFLLNRNLYLLLRVESADTVK